MAPNDDGRERRVLPLAQVVETVRLRKGRASCDPAVWRAENEKLAAWSRVPAGVSVFSADAGGVPAEWLRPTAAAGGAARCDGALLYFHGGGYCSGSLATHRELVARLALEAGVPALAVGYRLAPEHPYPAAVDDAVTAWRWLLGRGTPPGRVVVAGDSAGGGLALALTTALRDQGLELPAGAVCFSPWVDLAGTGESYTTRAAEDPMLTPDHVAVMARAYLGGASSRAPLASPLYASLQGLPPLFLQVGTAEILLDDSRRLAERARAAGVDVTLDEWPGLFHVFPYLASVLAEGREALRRAGAFVRGRLAAG